MNGRCDHCDEPGELTHVGQGIHYCGACRDLELQLLAASQPQPTKLVNQHGARRTAYPGERCGVLDKTQKAHLCILARTAFDRMHGRVPASAAELTAWRQDQQMKACGLKSLRYATQEHLPALEAHFLDLAGESGRAFERLMRPEINRQAVALARLRIELRAAGLEESYAAAICRQQYKCTLREASANQIWRIVFTIRNRAAAKRKAKR